MHVYIVELLMQRTTIMLPPALKLEAQQLARDKGISLGDLIRQALTALLREDRQGQVADPLFADTAVWSGDAPEDLSRDHDRYLYEEDLPGERS